MANYKEIVTKAVVGKGKKHFTNSYSIDVESNISKVTIFASLDDSNAKFVNGFGPREVNLNYGKNSIQIKVQGENKTTKIFLVVLSLLHI